jgi:hypothetical protein
MVEGRGVTVEEALLKLTESICLYLEDPGVKLPDRGFTPILTFVDVLESGSHEAILTRTLREFMDEERVAASNPNLGGLKDTSLTEGERAFALETLKRIRREARRRGAKGGFKGPVGETG